MLGAGAGILVLGSFGVWLAGAMGGRPADQPFAPRMLDEAMWPDAWPATTNIPFRGSPAAAWESGSAGIRLPQSKAVAGLTDREVSTGLGAVRDFLIDTNLSIQTLNGSSPARALHLLAPDDPARRPLEADATDPGSGRGSLQYLTRFDRDEVQVMVPEGMVKTHGTMTYEATPAGALLVRADYTFVYATVKTTGAKLIKPPGYEVARVVVHRELDILVRDGKLHPQTSATAIANDDCTAPADGFIHPLFYDDKKKTKEWAPVDPYDETEKHIDAAAPGACVRPTRT
ncbi:hypothetical protein ACFYY2_23105 [Streptomyces sp. NPDC001822]|uniref:hypothetical protein n=1 Tax=Streptomyces sp. NPDC001822 TaxID=3364614 RepID=UPI0036AA4B96